MMSDTSHRQKSERRLRSLRTSSQIHVEGTTTRCGGGFSQYKNTMTAVVDVTSRQRLEKTQR